MHLFLYFFFSAFCLTFAFCLGLGFAIGAIVDKRYKKTHCTYPVEAYCTSLGEDSLSPSLHNFNEDSGNIYSPSWKYTYQGKEYIYKSSYGSNITPPEKGDVYTIYIDPDNPEKAWVPQFSNHANFLMIGIIAIIISVVGMYCINFLM